VENRKAANPTQNETRLAINFIGFNTQAQRNQSLPPICHQAGNDMTRKNIVIDARQRHVMNWTGDIDARVGWAMRRSRIFLNA